MGKRVYCIECGAREELYYDLCPSCLDDAEWVDGEAEP